MKIIDLFCGCGGMSLGFMRAGHDIAAAFDNWEKALDVYNSNFSHEAYKLDLSDIETATEIISSYNPDMIIGGPPCQDFSSAGKRNEDNGRGDLTISYARIISIVRPRYFVMENVARIISTRKLSEAKSIFKNAGYGLSEYILDASLCGVPQSRKRFFMIGCLGENDNVFVPFIERNLSHHHMTIKEYLGDEIDFEYYYRHPRSYARRGVFSVNEPSPTIRGVNRPIPAGYPGHPGDATADIASVHHLSTEQRSRIQTFPKSFKFTGNKTDKEQMIGNAVPVNLAKFVGEAINEYISYKENLNSDSDAFRKYLDIEINETVPLMLFDPKTRYGDKSPK